MGWQLESLVRSRNWGLRWWVGLGEGGEFDEVLLRLGPGLGCIREEMEGGLEGGKKGPNEEGVQVGILVGGRQEFEFGRAGDWEGEREGKNEDW